MRRFFVLLAAIFAVVLLPATSVLAGSAHFVRSATSVTVSGNTITATFKLAGLGDEPQVHVVLSASAQCVNPGGNKPSAGNKQTVVAEGTFPVQNGQATGTLTATAVFQPDCSPPMTVEFSDITLTDTTSGATFTP